MTKEGIGPAPIDLLEKPNGHVKKNGKNATKRVLLAQRMAYLDKMSQQFFRDLRREEDPTRTLPSGKFS